MSGKKEGILSHIIIYLPSRYFSQGLGFFTSLFMKRFLGPFSAGIWDFLKVIMSYVDYAELGSTNAIYYKIPILAGQGRKEEAEKLKNVVFGFVMLCSFIAGAGILLYALISVKNVSRELFWGLIAASVLVVIERVHSFYVYLMRAYKDYPALSRSVYFDAVVNLLLVLLLVSRFKLYGVFLSIVILTTANIIFIKKNVNYPLKLEFDWKAALGYIKFGLPMYLASILTVLLNTVDRVMIAKFLGFQQLGFYSIAMMSKNYNHQLSTNFSHVTSPHFLEDFGKFGISSRIQQYITKGSFSLACFMSVVLGYIFLFSGPLIATVLPKFLPGLSALKILLLTSFFASLVTFPVNYIVTQNKQYALVVFTLISLFTNVSLNYLFIRMGFGIGGVSWATVIATFFYLCMVMVYSMKSFCSFRQMVYYNARIFLPALFLASVILLLETYVIGFNLWWNTGIKVVIFTAAGALIAILLEKETGLVGIGLGMLKKKVVGNGH